MPFKPSKGSAYRCDLRFGAPVGRIAKSLGTTDKREYGQRVACSATSTPPASTRS